MTSIHALLDCIADNSNCDMLTRLRAKMLRRRLA